MHVGQSLHVHQTSVACRYRLVGQGKFKPVKQVLIPLEMAVGLPVQQDSDALRQTINSACL